MSLAGKVAIVTGANASINPDEGKTRLQRATVFLEEPVQL
jgi:hypothetical protein